jgi:hypothetical protein
MSFLFLYVFLVLLPFFSLFSLCFCFFLLFSSSSLFSPAFLSLLFSFVSISFLYVFLPLLWFSLFLVLIFFFPLCLSSPSIYKRGKGEIELLPLSSHGTGVGWLGESLCSRSKAARRACPFNLFHHGGGP